MSKRVSVGSPAQIGYLKKNEKSVCVSSKIDRYPLGSSPDPSKSDQIKKITKINLRKRGFRRQGPARDRTKCRQGATLIKKVALKCLRGVSLKGKGRFMKMCVFPGENDTLAGLGAPVARSGGAISAP